MKNWFTIKAAAKEGDPVEISIFDEINPYYGVTAKNFIDEFKAKTANASKVTLAINSPGGDVFQGFAIYNALKASGKEINVRVMGIAASMASVIAMAGTTIEMPKNAMMMVHNAITGIYGDAEELRDRAEILDKIDASIVGIYATRTGKSEDEVRALLKDDTYMSAEEALKNGFATAVIEPVTAKAAFDLDGMPESVKTLFKGEASKPAPAPAAPTGTLGDQIKAMAEKAGLGEFVAVWALDESLTNVDEIQARISLAHEIKAIATAVGRPDDAPELIRERKTLAEARKAIATAAAAADKHVDTAKRAKAVQATGAQAHDFNPTALWAQINEMNAKAS